MNTKDEFLIDLNLYQSHTPSSSSSPFVFGNPLPPPSSSPLILSDQPQPPPLSPPAAMFLPDIPLSGPFLFSPPPPLSLPCTKSVAGPFIFSASVPPPLLLPGAPTSSGRLVPSTSSLFLPDTPSSGPFIFSTSAPQPLLLPGTTSSGQSKPPPLSPSPLLLPDTSPSSVPLPPSPSLYPQSRPRLRPRRRRNREERWRSDQASQTEEPRRNAEEERGSMHASQRQELWRNEEEERHISQVTSLGQSSLTERQIWEALDKLKNQVYNGEACAICLDYFVPKEEVSVTPCNHIFHEECLVPWVMRKGECPHCRSLLFESTRNQ